MECVRQRQVVVRVVDIKRDYYAYAVAGAGREDSITISVHDGRVERQTKIADVAADNLVPDDQLFAGGKRPGRGFPPVQENRSSIGNC